jgi:hypothetical protein
MKSPTPQSAATPLCRHFRTKKMFIPAQAADVDEDGAPCWCNRTMTPLGRDDRPAAPRTCREGRACFEG